MDRRQFMVAAGAVSVIGLAGCLGDDDTGSPEGVAEAYYEALEGDPDPEDAEGLIHPDSPIELEEEEGDEEIDFEYTSIDADASVALEDITWEEFEGYELEEEEDGELRTQNLSEEEFDAIAEDEEVTLVSVDLEVEIDAEDDEEAAQWEEFIEETPTYILTATSDGDWFILDDISIHFGGGF